MKQTDWFVVVAVVVAVAVAAGCGNKSDSDRSKAGSASAAGTTPTATTSVPEGCKGEYSVLVPFSGDLGGPWCLSVWQTFAGCAEIPAFTGLRVEFNDPDRLPGASGRGRFEWDIAKEDLVAGAELRFEKSKGELDGLGGSVVTRKNADGSEAKSELTSFSWEVPRKEGGYISTRDDGWTTGTIRIVTLPAKKCDPWLLELDLELHDPTFNQPLKLRAPKIEFR
jgi:hypothetical protein